MENDVDKTDETIEEPPPFFSSWNKLYSLVFLNLVALIVLFYVFTKYFD